MPGNARSGRKRKPRSVKIAEGNRRKVAQAEINRPEPRGVGFPRIPLHLKPDERQLFLEALQSLPPGLLTRADEGMLERYARAYSRWRTVGRQITETGFLIATPNGPRRNPLLAVEAQAAKEMHAAGSELGLSPVSRARLAGNATGEPDDPLEQLLGMESDPAWAAASDTRN